MHIARRSLLNMAAYGTLFGLTSKAALAQDAVQPLAPSPSETYTPGTIRLGDTVRDELIARLKRLSTDSIVTPFDSLSRDDLLQFLEKEDDGQGGLKIAASQERTAVEHVIRPLGRPVLFIRNGTFDTSEVELESVRKPLEKARKLIEDAIPSVGRIELTNHPQFSWVGTAWMVAADILVTNRHVAKEFATLDKGQYTFRRGVGRKEIRVSVDFLEEATALPQELEYSVTGIVHLEPDDGYDYALLRVAPSPLPGRSPLPKPIELEETDVSKPGDQVMVIGYPGRDSRALDQEVIDRIYKNTYDVKRLAPGTLTAVSQSEIQHDASTLPGSSGSAIISDTTGKAVALHWGGLYKTANYSVPAHVIFKKLNDVRAK